MMPSEVRIWPVSTMKNAVMSSGALYPTVGRMGNGVLPIGDSRTLRSSLGIQRMVTEQLVILRQVWNGNGGDLEP